MIHLSAFLNYLEKERRYSAHTIAAYERDLTAFSGFLVGHKAAKVSHSMLQNLKIKDMNAYTAQRMMRDKASKTSINRALSAIRSYFKWLEINYQVENHDIIRVRSLKAPLPAPKAITVEKSWKLIENITPNANDDWVKWRDFGLVILLYGLGLRVSEAVSINIGDIQSNNLSVVGKGSKERILPIPSFVKDTINQLVDNFPVEAEKTTPLFLNKFKKRISTRAVQMIMEKMRFEAGLPAHVTPHALRHSFATHLLANGANLRNVQEMLGHENISTTQRYLAADLKRIQSVHNKKHPLNQK